ncbi:MAG: hypothetical protein SFV15_12915 [Polyangiaceae bacterium]|nr:hypothetical protein [Polyangiaceae bacterium]
MRRLLVGSLLLLVSGAPGCASTPFDGKTYSNDELAFQVGAYPSTWRAIQAEGTLLAFRDDTHQATVALNGRCGKDGDDVPLTTLTAHLFLQFTDQDPSEQREVSLDGRSALRSSLTATLDGVPKRFVVYVLKKDECVYDFVWIQNQSAPQDSREFDAFVRDFRALSRP